MLAAPNFTETDGAVGVDMRKRCAFVATCDLPAKKRPTATTGLDEPRKPSTSPNGNLSDNETMTTTTAFDDALTQSQPTPMDPELQELIQKYVRADYVIHCLELAGFDSVAVFACLCTEATIRHLETFVGATCALMPSTKTRLHFLGPLYASHPRNFKLPAGVVCGLRLAVEELRRNRPYLFPTAAVTSLSFSPGSTTCESIEACAQTELSFPVDGFRRSASSITTSSSEGSPQDPSFANAVEQHPPCQTLQETQSLSFNLLEDCRRRFEGVSGSPEAIDVERLIQHSSASACRLAARQFINANIVRGQHFDMEMEVSGGGEAGGQKRVTGIFYCHLCREKRERTCAVRFSVARNRYPVMSNVLSHLKTHFRYQATMGVNGGGGASKKLSLASPTPPLPQPTAAHLLGGTPTTQPNPFLSTTSFCNLMSRVAQFAVNSANAGSPLALPQLVPQHPAAPPPPPQLQSTPTPQHHLIKQEQQQPLNTVN